MKSFENVDSWKRSLKLVASRFVDTQREREKLLKILKKAMEKALSEEDPKKIAFVAQTINSVLKTYDETRFNEDYAEVKRLLEVAKQKIKGAGQGTPVA